MSITDGEAIRALRVGVIAILLRAAAATVSLPGCPKTCGKISIPYPFGIGTGCSREGFNLTCSNSSNPPKLTLGDGAIQVLSIALTEGVVRINSNRFTFFASSDVPRASQTGLMDNGPYTFSVTSNHLVAVGCNVLASIIDPGDNQILSFCGSMCRNGSTNDGAYGGLCSGIGCCQTSISGGIKNFNVQLQSFNQSTPIWAIGLPSMAFLVEQNSYHFSPDDLRSSRHVWESRVIPAVLDWTIRENSSNSSKFACRSNNSEPYNSADRTGYRCNCSKGFHGNPYVIGGCEDINECEHPELYQCYGNCINAPGTYYCNCSDGHQVSARTSTDRTRRIINVLSSWNPSGNSTVYVNSKYIIRAVSTLAIVMYGLYRMLNEKRVKVLKANNFRRNKGLLLQKLAVSTNDAAETVKIFSSEELKIATNNFDRTRIVGQGGHGTVYKGILLNQRVVAIKKSNTDNQREIDQFINEVAILSQINHRNVVCLVGCCLETEVPLLVYEFISNGTLSQHLSALNGLSLSWNDRLRIAIETARALTYLHTAASLSVFHRDIKSANILLDDALTAKVSDFGASRSVPLDHTRVTTAIQGTFGYLDPEYYYTCQLTEKSDVYSFGVILLELLTGQKAVSSNILPEGKNLATYFLCLMKENRHFEVLEARVLEEGEELELESVAKLAEMCLKLKGEERPTMKEVKVRLEALRGSNQRLQRTRDAQKLEYLPDPPMPRSKSMCTTSDPPMPRSRSMGTARLFSLEKEFLKSVTFPR